MATYLMHYLRKNYVVKFLVS